MSVQISHKPIKRSLQRGALLLATLGLMPPASWAASKAGAAFLRIGSSARAEALGGAYTALAGDVHALRYNPAGLAQISPATGFRGSELAFTHAQWLLDSQFDFLGMAKPTSLGTFGLGIFRLGTGSQEGRDTNRQAVGGFSAADSAYALGWGRRLGQGAFGASFKYVESRIGSDKASTFALDMGASRRLDQLPVSLGISVLNVGQGLKYVSQRDPLPLSVALGAALRLGGTLSLAVDVRHEPYDRVSEVGIGTEYAVLGNFLLRAGYASQAARSWAGRGGLSALSGLGGGFGLKLRSYSLDYTFTPFGELGNAQRVSLGAHF